MKIPGCAMSWAQGWSSARSLNGGVKNIGRYQHRPCCSGFLDYRDPGAENEFFVARSATPLTLAGQLPTMRSFWYIPKGAKS
jgi:hypothetical protein